MNRPRIIYAGTPEFAVPALEGLFRHGFEPIAVYTQPDRPAGRGRHLTASPVKVTAQGLGIPVFQPEKLKAERDQTQLASLKPDLLIVVAYGLILPASVLAIPRLGCLNVHASLLPRWRGAAPIQRAVLSGDARTGVSLMRMDAGLDTGPVYAMEETRIEPGETAAELHDRLAELGADTLIRHLPDIMDGSLSAAPQPAEGVTYAAKLSKAESRIDWLDSAQDLENKVRGLNPWPVAETLAQGQVLRIWRARALPTVTAHRPPGMVVSCGERGLDVATGRGVLRIETLQRAGGRPVSAGDFARGHNLQGVLLGC